MNSIFVIGRKIHVNLFEKIFCTCLLDDVSIFERTLKAKSRLHRWSKWQTDFSLQWPRKKNQTILLYVMKTRISTDGFQRAYWYEILVNDLSPFCFFRFIFSSIGLFLILDIEIDDICQKLITEYLLWIFPIINRW